MQNQEKKFPVYSAETILDENPVIVKYLAPDEKPARVDLKAWEEFCRRPGEKVLIEEKNGFGRFYVYVTTKAIEKQIRDSQAKA